MKTITSLLRSLLFVALLVPALAWAGPTFLTIGGISVSQIGGPFVSDLGNGTRRWVTPVRWTNNNAFATRDLYFVVTSQWVQGNPSDATAMQWNDATGTFEKNGLVGEGDNEALFVELADTDIGALNPVFGVDPTDSLAAFFIGPLGAGQSVDTELNFLMSSAVNAMYIDGRIVQHVPEPQSAALVALALAGVAVSSRRRARR